MFLRSNHTETLSNLNVLIKPNIDYNLTVYQFNVFNEFKVRFIGLRRFSVKFCKIQACCSYGLSHKIREIDMSYLQSE